MVKPPTDGGWRSSPPGRSFGFRREKNNWNDFIFIWIREGKMLVFLSASGEYKFCRTVVVVDWELSGSEPHESANERDACLPKQKSKWSVQVQSIWRHFWEPDSVQFDSDSIRPNCNMQRVHPRSNHLNWLTIEGGGGCFRDSLRPVRLRDFYSKLLCPSSSSSSSFLISVNTK